LLGEYEVVQPTEQAQREVPAEVGCKVADPRIIREPATECCVERRAAVAIDRLAGEDLRLA
jgi:hypothetical protein